MNCPLTNCPVTNLMTPQIFTDFYEQNIWENNFRIFHFTFRTFFFRSKNIGFLQIFVSGLESITLIYHFRVTLNDRELLRMNGFFNAHVPVVQTLQNLALSHRRWNVSNVPRDLSSLIPHYSTQISKEGLKTIDFLRQRENLK